MALIKCSECGKEVSDKANTCPNCGNPNTLTKEELSKEIEEKAKVETKNNTTAVIVTIVGVILFFVLLSFLWSDLEGDKLLDAVGINTSNSTVTIREKSKDQVKDDIMDWLGFEKE